MNSFNNRSAFFLVNNIPNVIRRKAETKSFMLYRTSTYAEYIYLFGGFMRFRKPPFM